MRELNKVEGGDFSVPVEEQRTTLFSAESPFRCSSTGAQDPALAPVVSVEEYREIMGDAISTDQQIVERLQYLELLFRGIIRNELRNTYGNKAKEI